MLAMPFFAFISSIVLTIAFFFAYIKGLHREYLFSDDYGALKVRIKADEKIKSSKDDYIDVSVQHQKGRKYVEVENLKYSFSIHRDAPDSRYYYLESDKIYLEPDNYRVRVEFGNELYHKDLYLHPRIIQKKTKDTFEGRLIEFNYQTIYRQPMRVYYSVMNDNKDITYSSDLYIYAYGTAKR